MTPDSVIRFVRANPDTSFVVFWNLVVDRDRIKRELKDLDPVDMGLFAPGIELNRVLWDFRAGKIRVILVSCFNCTGYSLKPDPGVNADVLFSFEPDGPTYAQGLGRVFRP